MKPVTTLLFLIVPFFSCSQDMQKSQDLDAVLSKLVAKSLMVGFSTIIIDNDKIKYQNSFGYADIAKQQQYNNDTKQPIVFK